MFAIDFEAEASIAMMLYFGGKDDDIANDVFVFDIVQYNVSADADFIICGRKVKGCVGDVVHGVAGKVWDEYVIFADRDDVLYVVLVGI